MPPSTQLSDMVTHETAGSPGLRATTTNDAIGEPPTALGPARHLEAPWLATTTTWVGAPGREPGAHGVDDDRVRDELRRPPHRRGEPLAAGGRRAHDVPDRRDDRALARERVAAKRRRRPAPRAPRRRRPGCRSWPWRGAAARRRRRTASSRRTTPPGGRRRRSGVRRTSTAGSSRRATRPRRTRRRWGTAALVPSG